MGYSGRQMIVPTTILQINILKERLKEDKLYLIINKNFKFSPLPGIEPGSPAWQAGILTTILQRPDVNLVYNSLNKHVSKMKIEKR